MSPKTIFTTFLILSCLIVTSGCHRNRVKTPAQPAIPVTTAPIVQAPAAAAPETAAPEEDATEPDPLSGELGDINEYLRRQGFLEDTYFDYDRSSLSSEAREQLAKSAQFLQGHPQLVLTLEGHCDERGTNEYNLALGERRAQAAKDYLVSMGASASLLNTISYGEERPICQAAVESCWWQNRRAHPVVTGRNDH